MRWFGLFVFGTDNAAPELVSQPLWAEEGGGNIERIQRKALFFPVPTGFYERELTSEAFISMEVLMVSKRRCRQVCMQIPETSNQREGQVEQRVS
jgi:hypothetical protein